MHLLAVTQNANNPVWAFSLQFLKFSAKLSSQNEYSKWVFLSVAASVKSKDPELQEQKVVKAGEREKKCPLGYGVHRYW